jgi:hypothetical protein
VAESAAFCTEKRQVITTDFPCIAGSDLSLVYYTSHTFNWTFCNCLLASKTSALLLRAFESLPDALLASSERWRLSMVQHEQKTPYHTVSPLQQKNYQKRKRFFVTNTYLSVLYDAICQLVA